MILTVYLTRNIVFERL